ncbi:MAG: glycosyltransferase family 4 protein [Promethearchaeota archaeon]
MSKVNHQSICYIVPSYTPDEASHMAHLPHFLGELGKYCDVRVIIQRGKGQPRIPNVRSVYVQRPGNHFERATELIRLALRLRREGCRKFFIRISASAALEVGLIGRLMGLQTYYWLSGQVKHMKPTWRKGLRRRMYYEVGDWLVRLNIRLAHRFVTGPKSMVDYFVREYAVNPAKIILMYNDINLDAFAPVATATQKERLRMELGLPAKSSIILSSSRVSPNKGGHFLPKIAQSLYQHRVDTLLVVVGDIHLPRVVEIARQEGLSNLLFLGPVPNTQLPKFYQAADVFILPSEEEGFPRKILEAMACGIPIVAFDVGGVRDILAPEQFPFIIPRGDIQSLVNKAITLLNDPSLRAEQARLGVCKVRHYSTERVARMFVERIVYGE